jgi:hypothetical protein
VTETVVVAAVRGAVIVLVKMVKGCACSCNCGERSDDCVCDNGSRM